ncbi:hypothetical protein [Acinetobacter lwoffii]|uniref:hypothetical protein n=1 Tax=Acinetobacter lwoffii TaxID=28090 RepID=UPI0030088575
MTEIQVTYIPKGKIVPNWILRFKNKKRQKYKVKSNGFYVARHKDGALYMWPEGDHSCLIVTSNLSNVSMDTAPYTKYGSVMFYSRELAIAALSKPVIDSRGAITKLSNAPGKKRDK